MTGVQLVEMCVDTHCTASGLAPEIVRFREGIDAGVGNLYIWSGRGCLCVERWDCVRTSVSEVGVDGGGGGDVWGSETRRQRGGFDGRALTTSTTQPQVWACQKASGAISRCSDTSEADSGTFAEGLGAANIDADITRRNGGSTSTLDARCCCGKAAPACEEQVRAARMRVSALPAPYVAGRTERYVSRWRRELNGQGVSGPLRVSDGGGSRVVWGHRAVRVEVIVKFDRYVQSVFRGTTY
ncbi:hypothetical protein R3P38DRAFT_1958345 [Favolaschia claudopus]|uniref:Uncharacterized protein n=1 Tax=Favolaschia claudopus TaxID=2862362 RepID=A0AAV9ZZN3_9AGAR